MRYCLARDWSTAGGVPKRSVGMEREDAEVRKARFLQCGTPVKQGKKAANKIIKLNLLTFFWRFV